MKALPSAARRVRAFTLVEMLVSMSVLVLLLVMVLQMINGAMMLTTDSTKRLDADSQVRLVFDRMAVDFSQIVKRGDVDYFMHKTDVPTSRGPSYAAGTNDQIAFYSETSGYYPSVVTGYVPKSNAALVGYCINSRCQFLRLNKALVWNGVSGSTVGATGLPPNTPAMTFLPQATAAYLSLTLPYVWPTTFSGSANPNNNGSSSGNPDMGASTDPDYQVIGEQIFRMEICYLVRSATIPLELSDLPYAIPVTATTATLPAGPPYPYNGLRDVVAVVVTLAVLDNSSRGIVPTTPNVLLNAATRLENQCDINSIRIVPGTSVMQPLTTPPPSPPTPPITPASVWQAHVDSGDLVTSANLPKAAASRVRVYERYFYLGNKQ